MPGIKKTSIILGIDPGIADMGYGVIQRCGPQLSALAYGSLKTSSKTAEAERLSQLKAGLDEIIKKYRPDCVVIEKLFFCNNAKTAIAVGQARGVAMLCAGEHCLLIKEYTPLQVKVAITGYGQADKKQIQQMIKIVLKLKEIPRPDDAADALAIAVCGANTF